MIDRISIDRLSKLHPKVRASAIDCYNRACAALTGRAGIRIVQGYRTFPEQDALYKKRPKVTNAKAGQSYHNYGLAIDFALLVDGKTISWDISKDWDGDGAADWKEVVAIFEKDGWSWGGKWSSLKDYPHLEMTFGRTWRELLALHNEGKVDDAGYVNLELK